MTKRQALGQHFLASSHVAQSIVDSAGITSEDTVQEVGTGKGILTPYLCGKAKKVISVEKDPVLFSKAKARFSSVKNLVLEQGDAFEMDVDFTVFVSNLPYSESRNAVEWLVQRKFSHGTIMVQKEFAQKLLSKGGKGRRAVSVLAGYCMEMDKIMDVKKTSFQPVPRVDSVVLSLRRKHTVSHDVVAAVNKMFSYKRKTVGNMARKFGLEIASDKRLEDLPDGEIIGIAKKIA